MTLTSGPNDLESLISSSPKCSIYASIGSNPFIGSRATAFTRFPWLSLCDLQLWPRDLENLSPIPTHMTRWTFVHVSLKFLQITEQESCHTKYLTTDNGWTAGRMTSIHKALCLLLGTTAFCRRGILSQAVEFIVLPQKWAELRILGFSAEIAKFVKIPSKQFS